MRSSSGLTSLFLLWMDHLELAVDDLQQKLPSDRHAVLLEAIRPHHRIEVIAEQAPPQDLVVGGTRRRHRLLHELAADIDTGGDVVWDVVVPSDEGVNERTRARVG